MWFTERSNGVIKWQENVDSKEYLARYDRLDWQEYHYHKSVDADPKIWEWCQNLPAENSIVQLENRFNGKQVTFRNYDSFESENISFRIATLIVD